MEDFKIKELDFKMPDGLLYKPAFYPGGKQSIGYVGKYIVMPEEFEFDYNFCEAFAEAVLSGKEIFNDFDIQYSLFWHERMAEKVRDEHQAGQEEVLSKIFKRD